MLGEVDAGRHRGMRRSAQEQQLGDAEAQDVLYHRRPRRQGRVEAIGDQRIDLAEPAQYRRDQQPRKSAVAHRQDRHVRIVFDGVVEGAFSAEHRAQKIERDLPGSWRRGHQCSSLT